MSIQVRTIEPNDILDRLRKSEYPHKKEVVQCIKAYQEALKRQQQLTADAISKIRELSKNINNGK